MQTYLKLFCIALPISIALDASWIGVIAAGFYQTQFGSFFRPDPVILAAALFYVLYAVVLIYFVLDGAVKERSLAKAVIGGAVLGFAAYMTYDLTNIATLAGWPIFGAFIDTSWGTLMTALTSGITYLIATKVFKM
jgi:uncharacterized membrane protein